MDNKLILAKSITLLYRESQLTAKSENSSDLIRTVLENVQVSDIGIGMNSDREITLALKATILEMCSLPQDHIYDKTELLQRIRLNCGNDDKLYEAIKQGIEDELNETQLKRSIGNIRKSIHNHFKEQQINDILNNASSTFKFKREKIKDINQFITDLINQLEPLNISNTSKDPAVMGDIDIGNEESLREVFHDVVRMNDSQRVYKTGWPALNRMLQGGFRPGEEWVFNALQHKYKSGFSLSLFAQIALFNKPFTTDPAKKPLLLRISFEDPLVNSLQFLYQYLKHSDTGEPIDVRNVTKEEMASYVRDKLQINGFHVKMLRVDPTQWTYKSICNKIIELEANGYAVEVLDLDYLYKVPTTGCATGPAGTDIMDMFARMRGFCAGRGILLRTPHQLSTEAKNLLRSGIPEDQFVKELVGKGYFEGTKGLDRIYDGGLILHLFKHNRETYLSVQLDKHRFPTIAAEEDRYFILKFPKGMPIPHSNDETDTSFTKIQSAASNASDELFKL